MSIIGPSRDAVARLGPSPGATARFVAMEVSSGGQGSRLVAGRLEVQRQQRGEPPSGLGEIPHHCAALGALRRGLRAPSSSAAALPTATRQVFLGVHPVRRRSYYAPGVCGPRPSQSYSRGDAQQPRLSPEVMHVQRLSNFPQTHPRARNPRRYMGPWGRDPAPDIE